MNTVTLSRNGATRTIPRGFSWTTLFFGPAPSIFRWHWSFAIKVIACDIIALFIACGIGLFPLVWLSLRIAISMIRNEELFKGLKKYGWQHTCLDKGIEIRSNTNVAANDEEEYLP